MTDQLTCPTCGTPISSSMKFCRTCGSPVAGAAENAPVQAATEVTPTIACATCGTVATNPTQKFCAVCGGSLAAAPAAQPAAAQSGAATTAATAAAGGAASAASSVQDGFAQAQSKLNDFMGASIDTSNVGANFNAQDVTLSSANEASVSAAFSYFGKSYSPLGQTAATADIAAVERREQAEAQEAEARAKEERDFSAHEGGTFCGAFATKLQAGAAPTANMVSQLHGKAAKAQEKSRLKRKVALGDMDKRKAVEAAERL